MRKHEIAALGRDRCQFCGAAKTKPCLTSSYMSRMPHAHRPSLKTSVESRFGKMLVKAMVLGPKFPKKRRLSPPSPSAHSRLKRRSSRTSWLLIPTAMQDV